jgi:hypothetical protein
LGSKISKEKKGAKRAQAQKLNDAKAVVFSVQHLLSPQFVCV